jgi:hypothetical protein
MPLTAVLRQRGNELTICFWFFVRQHFRLTERTWTFKKVLYFGFPSGYSSGLAFSKCPAERKASLH